MLFATFADVVRMGLLKIAWALWCEDKGQDLVEYSLLLAFIALAAVALLSGVRTNTKGIWSTINSALISASTTAS